MSDFDDVTAGLEEADIERAARVKDLQHDLRPWANIFVTRYNMYLTQFGGDDAKAFQSMILYLQVGVEMGHYEETSLLAMVAFMARRLNAVVPQLARSLN